MFCVDEKTAIQALDRKDRMLPLALDRAESHGFEYKRNGALSLFAALNTATGEVLGMTAPRHTSEQFVSFLGDVVGTQPRGRELHIRHPATFAHCLKPLAGPRCCSAYASVVDMVPVPYEGSGPALTDVMGRQVPRLLFVLERETRSIGVIRVQCSAVKRAERRAHVRRPNLRQQRSRTLATNDGQS